MKVYEYIKTCPCDYEITIYWTRINEEFFIKNKNEPCHKFGIFYKQVMETEIEFVHVNDDLKSIYIRTIVE